MRVVIAGSGGRLGGAIVRHFQSEHRVVAFDRKALDLSRPEIIDDRLLPIRFDLLINAAAVTNVDYCERHAKEAYAVNAEGPAQMARICAQKGARMVHVSTDYVYDGSEAGTKSESAALDPLGVYARSKLDGEDAVRAAAGDALVLRTAWVFGPDRPSFVDSIIERAAKSEMIEAIGDKFASPTYSNDFGKWVELLAERRSSGGVFNACNEGCCSWQEFAQAAINTAGKLGLGLRAGRVAPIKLADMESFVARRPRYSAMSVDKLADATGSRPRHWRTALQDYLATFYAKS